MSDSGIIYNVFFLLGGIAVLLFGIKAIGSNLQKATGGNLKNMFKNLTGNRFAGVGAGAVVTAILQSSTATTVMLVGFVNVGVMTLSQAAAVIMGANVGTTVTAQVMSLTGLSFDISAIAAFIGAVGMFMTMISKKEILKRVGQVLLGLGMIFIGLKIMTNSVDYIVYDRVGGEKVLRPFFEGIFGNEVFPLLLVLIGIVLTALVHSSATVTGILIALSTAIRLDTAIFVILGSNIGTCVTSIVSSLGTNINARRTAVIHLLFNLLGCIMFIVPVWIFKDSIGGLLEAVSGASMERQIANFHTVFNLVTTLVLLPFINPLVKLTKLIVPEKKVIKSEKEFSLSLDDRLLKNIPIASYLIKVEILKMADLAYKNLFLAKDILIGRKLELKEELEKNEGYINEFNRGISFYLAKILAVDDSLKDDMELTSYFHVVSDIERVGDYAENLMEYAEKLGDSDSYLSEDAKEELGVMFDDIKDLFPMAKEVFSSRNKRLLPEIDKLEEHIDYVAKILEDKHVERLKENRCTPEVGSCFLQSVSDLERIGDHITNVAYSIKKVKV